MAKKGVVIKEVNGEQVLNIHLPTLHHYLNQLPKDHKGWHCFRMILLPPDQAPPISSSGHPTTHALQFIRPSYRELKIEAPTQLNKAG
jgi:hypothetical protein